MASRMSSTAASRRLSSIPSPGANHGALIADLRSDDREAVVQYIADWTGVPLSTEVIVRPSRAPLPPGLLRER